jgi:hypothetical protein
MDTYATITFVFMAGLILLFLWSKRRKATGKKYALSDNTAKEVTTLVEEYRQVLSAHGESVMDTKLLPDAKETIKEYLQIALGLARLNREPAEELVDAYYFLARFQHPDPEDEQFFPITAEGPQQYSDREAVPSGETDGASPAARGHLKVLEEKYRERIARETATLEKELEVFLKGKRLF